MCFWATMTIFLFKVHTAKDVYHPALRYRMSRQPQDDAKRGRAMHYNVTCLQDMPPCPASQLDVRGAGRAAGRQTRWHERSL
ncbi:hypothetical protein C8R47DRAFT_813936 [Mycena vitilis]|nr:hypothetical protein C8R47DRAFT_813936 [Mycena vitilis]